MRREMSFLGLRRKSEEQGKGDEDGREGRREEGRKEV